MLREGEEIWTKSRRLDVPRQGTHASYAAHKLGGRAQKRFIYLSKTYRGRWKKQRHNKRAKNNTSRVHNDQHRAACAPQRTIYKSQQTNSQHIFQRLPSDTAYSQRDSMQGICKKCTMGTSKKQRRLLRKKDIMKRQLQGEHPSDQTIIERFRSSKERRPRDASPVSVAFRADRGQVLVYRFAQLSFAATSTACCCSRSRCDMREVRYLAAVVVGSSRRNLSTRTQVVMQCTLICRMSPREMLLLWWW